VENNTNLGEEESKSIAVTVAEQMPLMQRNKSVLPNHKPKNLKIIYRKLIK
jgi:hypothetical protein